VQNQVRSHSVSLRPTIVHKTRCSKDTCFDVPFVLFVHLIHYRLVLDTLAIGFSA
jgi:hypothetical protein